MSLNVVCNYKTGFALMNTVDAMIVLKSPNVHRKLLRF